MEGKKRVYNRRPTERQIKALQYIQQGESVRSALKKAGYSFGIYNQSTAFFKQPGVRKMLLKMSSMLQQAGLTDEKYIEKLKEFIDAKQQTKLGEQPDYKTQLKGWEYWDNVRQRENNGGQPKKRELTITEFVNDQGGESK